MSECSCKNILYLQPQCSPTLNVEPQCSPVLNIDTNKGGGTDDHNALRNRDLPDQHPISAITGLESALETLQSNIESEETAREEADTALDTKIDNIEISVEADIQAEATARDQADTRLEGLIEAEETRAKGVEEQLSDDITAENTRAVNAEEALQDNIDAEETRATTAEGNLQTAITNEASTRASEITRVDGLISAETTRAKGVESGLRTDLTAETSARQSADSTLQTNINNEKTARESADTTLQGNINAEALARQNADLTLQGNIDTEATTRGNADTALNTKIDNHIADKENPHQVTKAQVGLGNVDNTADIDKPISTAVSSAFDAVEDEINDINSKIPSQASSSNQLADKAFVNSTVQTSTANFRGNWETWSDVPTNAEDYPLDYAQSRTPTVNDYMVVRDASDYSLETLDGRWRFKYTGLWSVNGKSGWHPEYQVNETPFTASQWDAINSGATDTLINQITTNQNNITTIQTTMSGYGNIVTHNVSEFATSAQGTKADSAVQPADLATVATSGSYNDLDDKPTIGSGVLTIQKNGTDIDTFSANATANKTINMTVPTDTAELNNGAGFITGVDWGEIGGTLSNQTDLQNALNSKQDAISDLATIRAGAALGATSVQSVTTGTTNGTIKVDGSDVSVYGLGSAAYTASTDYDAAGSASTAETNAKNYADSLASNYATAAQGALADTAVQPADLATVATTGDYDDLSNKPTIPTVNDATLTIQKNGVSVATFTANSATNATANITVPTDTADLTNGAGFITSSALPTVNNSTITLTQGGVVKGSFTLNQATGDTIALDSGGSVINTDGVTINTNSNDELQAIGVIEKNAGSVKYDWVGTSAEYTAQNVATLHPTWVCYITDDEGSSLSILDAIYPVGSIYIGTMATCPLETLGVGTWQLKTDNAIITSISSVAIKGDGKALGVTTNGSNVLNLTEAHADFKMTSSYNGGTLPQTGGGAWTTTNGLIGLTPDATKSGIVGEAVTTSITVNIWERIS